jgi:hypothetical protein
MRYTNGVFITELKLQSVDLARVDGVLIENSYVEEPFFQIVGRLKVDTRRERIRDLETVRERISSDPRRTYAGRNTVGLPCSAPFGASSSLDLPCLKLTVRWCFLLKPVMV